MTTTTVKKKLTAEESKANTMAVNSSLRAVAAKGKPVAKKAKAGHKVDSTDHDKPDSSRLAVFRVCEPDGMKSTYVYAHTESEAISLAKDKGASDGCTAHFQSYYEESDDVSLSTDVFSKEVLTEFKKRSKVIKDSIGKIDASLEKIAFNLHWINAKQAYKADGFDTIVKYAQDTFGYQKTTCYSLISVVDRFAKLDERGRMLEEFDDRVKSYSVSKLSLMVNLTDREISSLKPTMSASEIRTFVKSLTAKPLPEVAEGNEDTGDMEEAPDSSANGTDKDVVDVESKDVTKQVLISCKGLEDYASKMEKIDDFIVRVLNKHPDALIEVSYTLPDTAGKKG